MVSWLVEVIAWDNGTFPDTFNMIGGVMLSGGSYTCCEYRCLLQMPDGLWWKSICPLGNVRLGLLKSFFVQTMTHMTTCSLFHLKGAVLGA